MKRFHLLAVGTLLAALGASAVPGINLVPRHNGNPALLLTATLPTTTSPLPESGIGDTCTNKPCAGQSLSVPGALHLNGCSVYWVTVCAGGANTLSGAGTLQVSDWQDYGGSVKWSRNSGLDETIPAGAAGLPCWTFPSHSAAGDWIQESPNGVTTSAGTTVTVNITAGCSN